MGKQAIALLTLTVSFLVAFVVSARLIVTMVTGTDAGSGLIVAVWLIVMAGVGLVMLVRSGFGEG